MATSSMIQAAGLHTFNNYLSAIPEGALFVAKNVNIDRAGVIEPRRGIAQYADLPNKAKQLLVYKDKLFAHYNNRLALIIGKDQTTVIKTKNDSLVEATFTSALVNLKIKSVEVNGNLYLTTSAGVLRFSSDKDFQNYEVEPAGGVKAVGLSATLDYSNGGFFAGYSKIGYRVTWGKIDKNETFIEGAPSALLEIVNSSAQRCNVSLTIDVPPQVNSSYFFRIYRTSIFTSSNYFDGLKDVAINDELKLVYEQGHNGVDTEYTVLDIAPALFRDTQAPLYTNEFSGEGILQANEAPPIAKDITLYSNYLFYANTKKRHSLLVTLLGTENLISYNSIEDTIKVSTINYIAGSSIVTFTANHTLEVGQSVVIAREVGLSVVFESKPVLAKTPTTIEVAGDITGYVRPTFHGSTVTVKQGLVENTYTFVGRREFYELTFPAEVAIPLYSFITLYSVDNSIQYAFWFDRSGGVDPVPTAIPSGSVAIRVQINIADTGIQVANKFVDAVINNTNDFLTNQNLVVPDNKVTVSLASSGSATDPIMGLTGVTVTLLQQGYGENTANKYVKLGKGISPSLNTFIVANSLVKNINRNTSEVVYAYYLFKANGLTGQIQLESRQLTSEPFELLANYQLTRDSFNPSLEPGNVVSSNEERANRVYYSKVQQPDSVPIINYIDVGPRDEAILRVVALRDIMFIFKEKSIYRLSGESPNNFSIVLHDNSSALVTPDALTVLNNNIYALTTQGVSEITYTGVSVKSRPIEDKITKILAPRFKDKLHTIFAASYEQDRAFFLWVPKIETDNYATECYRFNVFNNTWTTWDVNATSAIVVPAENVLYKGAGDTTSVERERKGLNRKDYADREFPKQIPSGSILSLNNRKIKINSIDNVAKGDTLVQLQYVTISQINRLVAKIQQDANTIDTNYTMRMSTGDSVSAFLTNLLATLIADGILPPSVSIDFTPDIQDPAIQVAYNALITALNSLASTLAVKNYTPISGSIEIELLVEGVQQVGNVITVLAVAPIVQGDLTLYKAIRSEVVYAPIAFGDPAIMKHIRAGTMMFANANLAFANLSYSTDLSPNYEGVDFTLEGDGSWGVFFYSSTAWGGEGTQRPFRTLIPRQKQRCRFIRPRLVHATAFYKYLLYGVSFDLEITNSRGYR